MKPSLTATALFVAAISRHLAGDTAGALEDLRMLAKLAPYTKERMWS